MPRLPRKSYESSFFHVIVQGYEKEFIFNEDYLKEKYLNLFLTEIPKYGVELLGYCIMGNHAHNLIYCDSIEQMSLLMKTVNTQFANYYNKEKNRVGYVFRDRFLSEPIKNQQHLYSCIPYIHLNPVVAGIVSNVEDYKYSSYNDFLNKTGIATDSALIKLYGDPINYLDIFHFIHSQSGEGIDFKGDIPKKSIFQSQKIVTSILNECDMRDIKEEAIEVQKYFYKRFLREGITVYHMEKILQIDHRRIKRILKL